MFVKEAPGQAMYSCDISLFLQTRLEIVGAILSCPPFCGALLAVVIAALPAAHHRPEVIPHSGVEDKQGRGHTGGSESEPFTERPDGGVHTERVAEWDGQAEHVEWRPQGHQARRQRQANCGSVTWNKQQYDVKQAHTIFQNTALVVNVST